MATQLNLASEPDSNHLVSIRRLLRLLDKERSAHTVLETYAQEFRDFRSMQAANRMTTAEANARKASDAVHEALVQWRETLTAA